MEDVALVVCDLAGTTVKDEGQVPVSPAVTTQDERVQRAVQEDYAIVPYDPEWPRLFQDEKQHLLKCLPRDLVRRIEHFGSTAIPGVAAKPIIDILVEVTDLAATRARIVPILEAQGYEYFWRPTHGEDGPPFYAWFIKRAADGSRTHHIHMVEAHHAEHWDRLLFRDYLVAHPEAARRYEALKRALAARHPADRRAYTNGKTEFILAVMAEARTQERGVPSVLVLETNRLALRRLSVDDAEFILELLNDPSFVRYIGDRGVRTTADARRSIQTGPMESYERFGFGLYLVELKETRESIGICGLLKRESLQDVDVGFALLPRFWSKGYAVEAVSAVLAYGRDTLGLKRIVAITSPDNVASINLLSKFGFRFERMTRLSEGSPEIKLFASDV